MKKKFMQFMEHVFLSAYNSSYAVTAQIFLQFLIRDSNLIVHMVCVDKYLIRI